MSPKQEEGGVGLPSYNDALSAALLESGEPTQSSIQTQVHDELLNLAIRYKNTRGYKAQQLQQHDQRTLSLLLPCIRNFLTEYSESALPRATLTIIPAGIVPDDAVSCDDDLQAADDFGRLVKLSTEQKDSSRIWSSADTVERLAAELQPRTEKQDAPVTGLQSPPAELSSAKKWLWNKKSKAEGTTPAPIYVDGMASPPKVMMHVKAEDVLFRMENDMGLWETLDVPGLVIRVYIKTPTPRAFLARAK